MLYMHSVSLEHLESHRQSIMDEDAVDSVVVFLGHGSQSFALLAPSPV